VQYDNPKIPEGINVTPEHPLKEFAQLLFGILAVTVIAVVALALAAEHIARHIPFRMELDLASQYRGSLPPRGPVTEYLQALADRLAAAQDLPAGMSITVHYVDEDTVNAFATIGGNVVFFRGLVEKLPSENALAMVMAHEIGHIKHRHPIMSLGRGVVVGLGLAAVTNLSGSNVVGTVLNDAGLLTVFSFTRQQEEEADGTALAALARLYGHVTGADGFFTAVQNLPDHQIKQKIPAFLSTHPATQDRIEKLRALAQQNGWAMDRPMQPLPETVQALVTKRPER
jgi:predicted Zn-dependent protease